MISAKKSPPGFIFHNQTTPLTKGSGGYSNSLPVCPPKNRVREIQSRAKVSTVRRPVVQSTIYLSCPLFSFDMVEKIVYEGAA